MSLILGREMLSLSSGTSTLFLERISSRVTGRIEYALRSDLRSRLQDALFDSLQRGTWMSLLVSVREWVGGCT